MESWRERSLRRKVEQSRDPRRPLCRGIFKGVRPKGRKARLDELLQAKKEFFKDLDWLEEAKGRHAKFAKRYGVRVRSLPFRPWPDLRWCRESLERSRGRYLELLAGCERDGLI
jgi:hypothetical protein